MDLNSLLVLDANSLLESATALWTVIGVSGGILILNVLTFIKTSVSGKKFSKVSDFAVVADQSIKFAKNEMKALKEELVIEVNKTIVEPMKQQVQALVSDNAKLASLVVSLISYIPLPLEVKKEAVAVTGTLSNVIGEAQKLLQSSVEHQEKQTVLVEAKDTELKSTIDNI